MTKIKHFLDLKDIDATDLRLMIDSAREMKAAQKQGRPHAMLNNKKLAMIFEKSSTRTRVSFESGMFELGGHALNLSANDLQLGRGESIADTARVLSRMVDGIMMRANSHDSLTELAQYADIPIINGLTDQCHPCQLMADILTIEEHLGRSKDITVAWIGDGNNVAHSFITAAVKFDFTLNLACPAELSPSDDYMHWAASENGRITLTTNPEEATQNADVVVTDTWVSMGDTDAEERMGLLTPYQVNETLMAHAQNNAIFMHCLPAHREEEVTTAVIDGPQSVIWDEAENRLHAQKAVMEWCMGGEV